jgi:hypothetical protein
VILAEEEYEKQHPGTVVKRPVAGMNMKGHALTFPLTYCT